ncbi:MAG: DNA repair helicase XPB [Candidatus Thermoplasmatota archaeon]|nr:DNA repair helicase XPB [Candidatus Thermoplasmatota archaeon]
MTLQGPLVIQSDHTFLLEVEHPLYDKCRDLLVTFAELVKSPEFIHTYRVTPLSLWNAAALEITLVEIESGLRSFSRYDIPGNVLADIREWYNNYGKVVLVKDTPGRIRLVVDDPVINERLVSDEKLGSYCIEREGNEFLVDENDRGELKYAMVKAGFPVKDLCGYTSGIELDIALRDVDSDGVEFDLYDYQLEAVDAFYRSGKKIGGSGIIVLPCGSGKTIIGLGVMSEISNNTLIITTNNVAVHQWIDEIHAKTHIREEDVGEFTGLDKKIKPITVTTYQMLTHRRSRKDNMENLEIFRKNGWGLIIYDEVHMLPAPVFRVTSGIQARRRLGLTATLIREDGKEDEVFALIGPKRYDVPWKVLENRGYIAEAICTEYRIVLPAEVEMDYAHATKRRKFRIAAENPAKLALVRQLIINHPDDSILIIGQYISQVEGLSKELDVPIITGKTRNSEREKLYSNFRTGKVRILVVSKVANFAVDLPDASMMIQVSGTFGSRQEEAQRLGRILRPKDRTSHFYTLVSARTVEQTFGINRQLYLVEQGYRYQIRYYSS